jgi:hypothetical protein
MGPNFATFSLRQATFPEEDRRNVIADQVKRHFD